MLIDWKKSDDPPKTSKGTWSRDVIAVTNFGAVCLLAYYHGGDGGGVWQRPFSFITGEKVELWTEKPKGV